MARCCYKPGGFIRLQFSWACSIAQKKAPRGSEDQGQREERESCGVAAIPPLPDWRNLTLGAADAAFLRAPSAPHHLIPAFLPPSRTPGTPTSGKGSTGHPPRRGPLALRSWQSKYQQALERPGMFGAGPGFKHPAGACITPWMMGSKPGLWATGGFTCREGHLGTQAAL